MKIGISKTGIKVIETRTNMHNIETYVFEYLMGRYIGKFGVRSMDRNSNHPGPLFEKQYNTKAEAMKVFHG